MEELVFSRAEFEAVLPSAILFATGLLLLLMDTCFGDRDPNEDSSPKTHLVLTGVAGALLAFAALSVSAGDTSVRLFAGAMTDDLFGRFAAGIIILATLLTSLAAGGYLSGIGKHRGEFHALIFLGAGAMVLLAQATNLISIFVAVETLSLALYVLAGYVRAWRESAEGAFKYFIMGAFSSGFLLLGMAFLYGASGGSIQLADFGDGLDPVLGSVGTLLVIIGFAFKVGAVPFHSWVPDVYQGSPVLAAGWMAVAVKVASFAALLRLVMATGDSANMAGLIMAIAVITMALGNLAALNQTNLKRMLAYSGIAHSGYLMIPVGLALHEGSVNPKVLAGSLFYLAAYLVTTLGVFVALSSLKHGDRDCDTLDAIKGLGRRHPLIALAITLSMVSLAGIPLTGGFMGKYFIFRDAVLGGYWQLAVIGIVTSMVSIYYYLRPVVAMYFHEPSEKIEKVEAAWGLHLALGITSFGILYLGVMPERLVALSLRSVERLGM